MIYIDVAGNLRSTLSAYFKMYSLYIYNEEGKTVSRAPSLTSKDVAAGDETAFYDM